MKKTTKKFSLISNSFFINTLLILFSGFLVKILGLINRIFITRLLGTSGMSLYIMAFPTIMLFIGISGMSLNISVSKLVSENLKTNLYNPQNILKKAIKIAIITSIFTSIIFIIVLKPLVYNWLKNEQLYIPLLSTIPLIFLVGISDSLKGYFNGFKMMFYSSFSNLIEQIFRITFSLIFLFIMLPYGNVLATLFCLLAMSVGELASILYSLTKIKKIKLAYSNDINNQASPTRSLLSIAVPSTLSRLIGTFTYFLEPIIFVFILSYLKYPLKDIETNYTIVNAYTISLLTLGSFVSIAISTVIVPSISESYVTKNLNQVTYLLKKTIIFSLLPGLFISIALFFYPNDLMQLIYGTTLGSSEIKWLIIFFLPYYLQAPLSSILQAMGQAKFLFITSTICNILRLLLIIILACFPLINYQSLILATFITLDLFFVINYLKIKKLISFKISFDQSVNLGIVAVSTILLFLFLQYFNVNYLIVIIIGAIYYLLLALKLKLINIASLKFK